MANPLLPSFLRGIHPILLPGEVYMSIFKPTTLQLATIICEYDIILVERLWCPSFNSISAYMRWGTNYRSS